MQALGEQKLEREAKDAHGEEKDPLARTLREDEAPADAGQQRNGGTEGGQEGKVVDRHEGVGAISDVADTCVGAGRTKDAEQGDGDGESALGGRNLVEVSLGGVGLDGVVHFAEDGRGMGDEDDADHGYQPRDELLAGERLAEEKMTGPGGSERDEKAEDGGFGERKVVDGVVKGEEAKESCETAKNKPSSHLGRPKWEVRDLFIPHVQEAQN